MNLLSKIYEAYSPSDIAAISVIRSFYHDELKRGHAKESARRETVRKFMKEFSTRQISDAIGEEDNSKRV
jgi:hypothetical protein